MRLPFSLRAVDPGSRARRGTLLTAHGPGETPAFMAVGTPRWRAEQPGLPSWPPKSAQVVLGNTYHLMLRPGVELFRRVGGIHNFMGWRGPVLTDSGGYQIFSLPGDRTLSEQGARFRSYTDSRIHMLSPERSIEMQTAIGSDIVKWSSTRLRRPHGPTRPDDARGDGANAPLGGPEPRGANERDTGPLRDRARRSDPGAPERVRGRPHAARRSMGSRIGGLAVGDARPPSARTSLTSRPSSSLRTAVRGT